MEATPEERADSQGAADAGAHDADDDLKAKYREALNRKHGSSGAQHIEHGDSGDAPHPQQAGPTHRVFRRKTG